MPKCAKHLQSPSDSPHPVGRTEAGDMRAGRVNPCDRVRVGEDLDGLLSPGAVVRDVRES